MMHRRSVAWELGSGARSAARRVAIGLGLVIASVGLYGCRTGAVRTAARLQSPPPVPDVVPTRPQAYLPEVGTVLRFHEEYRSGEEHGERELEVEVIAVGDGEAVVAQRSIHRPPPKLAARVPARGAAARPAEKPERTVGTNYFIVRFDDHVLRTTGDPQEARPLLPWPPEEGAVFSPAQPTDEGSEEPEAASPPTAPQAPGQKPPSLLGEDPADEGPRLRVTKGPHLCQTADGPKQGCVEVEYLQAPGCKLVELYAPGLFHVRAQGRCGEQSVKITLLAVARVGRRGSVAERHQRGWSSAARPASAPAAATPPEAVPAAPRIRPPASPARPTVAPADEPDPPLPEGPTARLAPWLR